MTSRSLSLVLLLVLALVGSSSLYVIQETELGVKLRFGRLVETDIQPGLHYKIPFVDQVRKFDGRVLTLDADPGSTKVLVDVEGGNNMLYLPLDKIMQSSSSQVKLPAYGSSNSNEKYDSNSSRQNSARSREGR